MGPQSCREEPRQLGECWGAAPHDHPRPPLPRGAGAGLLVDEVGLSHTRRHRYPAEMDFQVSWREGLLSLGFRHLSPAAAAALGKRDPWHVGCWKLL